MVTETFLTQEAILNIFVLIKQQNKVQEVFLDGIRSEVKDIKTHTAVMEQHIENLEQEIERQNYHAEKIQKKTEKKCMDARTLLEKKRQAKQEVIATMDRLTQEMATITSENMKHDEFLSELNRCMNILEKAIPLKDKKTLVTKSKMDNDSCEYEDELHQYLSDPQQVLDTIVYLSETVKSLTEACHKAEQSQNELQKLLETKVKKIQEDTEKLAPQVNSKKDIINKMKTQISRQSAFMLKSKSEEPNDLSQAKDFKVSEIYRWCVNRSPTTLNTLEKMTSIENEVLQLLEVIENIHDEKFDKLKKKQTTERRDKERKKKLALECKKREEKMKKHDEKALCPANNTRGRKLMFRSVPVKKSQDKKLNISEEKDDDLQVAKKHEEAAKLKETSEVDLKCLPPIFHKDKLKAKDTLALRELCSKTAVKATRLPPIPNRR